MKKLFNTRLTLTYLLFCSLSCSSGHEDIGQQLSSEQSHNASICLNPSDDSIKSMLDLTKKIYQSMRNKSPEIPKGVEFNIMKTSKINGYASYVLNGHSITVSCGVFEKTSVAALAWLLGHELAHVTDPKAISWPEIDPFIRVPDEVLKNQEFQSAVHDSKETRNSVLDDIKKMREEQLDLPNQNISKIEQIDRFIELSSQIDDKIIDLRRINDKIDEVVEKYLDIEGSLAFSRRLEVSADLAGIKYLVEAGIDPVGGREFLLSLIDQGSKDYIQPYDRAECLENLKNNPQDITPSFEHRESGQNGNYPNSCWRIHHMEQSLSGQESTVDQALMIDLQNDYDRIKESLTPIP